MIGNYLALAFSVAFLCWWILRSVRSWFEGDPDIPPAKVVLTAEPERSSTPLGPGDALATLFFIPVLAASLAWICILGAVFFSPLILLWMAFQ